MAISIGTKVRSFDFHYMRDVSGPRACYIEGIVTGTMHDGGCERYVIQVSLSMSGGEEDEDGTYPAVVIPPVNGTPTTMGRVTDYVEAI